MYITNFTIGVQSKEYSGDQVYRLEVQTPNQIEYLQNLENNGADFWTEVLTTIIIIIIIVIFFNYCTILKVDFSNFLELKI